MMLTTVEVSSTQDICVNAFRGQGQAKGTGEGRKEGRKEDCHAYLKDLALSDFLDCTRLIVESTFHRSSMNG